MSQCALCTAPVVLAIAALLAGCDSSLKSPSVSAVPATPDPLVVSRVEPPEGPVELGPRFAIRVTFAESLDPATVDGAVLVESTSTGSLVPGAERVEAGATPPQAVLIWQPEDGAMEPDASYTVRLAATLRSDRGGAVDPETPGFPVEYEAFRAIPELLGSVDVLVTSCSSAEVSWNVTVTDNSPPEEIAYRVLLGAAGSLLDEDDFVLETAPGATRAFLEELDPSTAYEAAVAAVDGAGNTSSPTGAVSFATPPEDRCDPIPPEFSGVAELLVDPFQPQAIVARWEAGADNETASEDLRYAVYVALSSGAQDFSAPYGLSDPGAARMAITGLSASTTHFVVVRAVDSTGNEDSNLVELAATTPASFRLEVRPILDRSPPFGGGCTRPFCHSAPTNSGGLNLETYDGMVAVGGATKDPPVVNPGDSVRSYLLWRTDESNPNFVRGRSRMPLASPQPLSREQLDAIKRWIDQGALDN